MVSAEAPDRDTQIELVYQNFNEPSRSLLRAAIPSDRAIELKLYGSTDQQISSLILGTGHPYIDILAVAAGARNPIQLGNAVGALALLGWHSKNEPNNPRNFTKRLDISCQYFLNHIAKAAPPWASDEARAMQAEMMGIWNREKQNPTHVVELIAYAFKIGNFSATGQRDMSGYWTESYLLTIFDPQTPIELRKLLLENALMLNFGNSLQRNENLFAQNTSFWKHVDARWIYPDIFGAAGGGDMKDWEIAGLRKKMADLQDKLRAQPDVHARLAQERAALQGIMLQMAGLVQKSEERLKIYKDLGQHPLDALKIGYSNWRMIPPDERAKLVREAYRTLAKKYHYQIPHSDPRYDPLLEELANKEFVRLTVASDYLNGHLSEDEF